LGRGDVPIGQPVLCPKFNQIRLYAVDTCSTEFLYIIIFVLQSQLHAITIITNKMKQMLLLQFL